MYRQIMNTLLELSQNVEKYFSSTDEDEKELLVQKTKKIISETEKPNFIKKCLEDSNDDDYMDNIKTYIRMKEHEEKTKIVKEEGKIYLFI